MGTCYDGPRGDGSACKIFDVHPNDACVKLASVTEHQHQPSIVANTWDGLHWVARSSPLRTEHVNRRVDLQHKDRRFNSQQRDVK